MIGSFGQREIRPLRVFRTRDGYRVRAELREGDADWRPLVATGKPQPEHLRLPEPDEAGAPRGPMHGTVAMLASVVGPMSTNGRDWEVELHFVGWAQPAKPYRESRDAATCWACLDCGIGEPCYCATPRCGPSPT